MSGHAEPSRERHADDRLPAIDPGTAIRSLVAWLSWTLVGTAVLLSALVALLAQREWWQGLLAAFVLNALAAAVSVVTMRVGLTWGLRGAVGGHFIGMALRLFVVLAGALLLVKVGDYPAAPTFTLAVPLYLALLGAESVSLGRLFWRADRAPHAPESGVGSWELEVRRPEPESSDPQLPTSNSQPLQSLSMR